WSPDGRYLLTGDERLAHCWDVTNWVSLSTVLYRGDRAQADRAAAWSPDSRRVLGSSGLSWSLWDGPSGQLHSTAAWHAMSASVWDPTGQFIATYGDDANLLIWQTSGRQPQQHLSVQPGIMSIAAMADGVHWLAQDTAGVLQLRELAT